MFIHIVLVKDIPISYDDDDDDDGDDDDCCSNVKTWSW